MNLHMFLIFYLSLSQVNLLLPIEKREELFHKYAKKISGENLNDFYLEPFQESMSYDKAKIDDLIQKYSFPSEYNFIEKKGAKVHIKDQESCGCCWAMSSTTALAYRYFLKGIEVDLSPQHELSCYVKNCDHGNNLIDPQLSLIKNGTITEECLPFSSGSEIIEECPTTCKNTQIEYKKYYAKNAYAIGMSQDNIYDVTAIIIDQLIANGPVVTSFTVYEDLQNMCDSDSDCPNKVYTYDGVSELVGGHAVTIVGYGYLDNKYYWLIQNSWGEKSCKTGFNKIEFGQVGIGSISFSEPYIEEQATEDMNVQFGSLNKYDCSLEVTSNSNLDNWKSQLNVIFKHKGKSVEFDYICGVNKILNEPKKIYCSYEFNNKETLEKGEYVYDSFKVIGKENTFSLDNSFAGKKFVYYGYDSFLPLSKILENKEFDNYYYFVSEKGSRFSFIYDSAGIDQNMSPILTINSNKPLSNCQRTSIALDERKTRFIAYCELQSDEIYDFDEYPPQTEYQMINIGLCQYPNFMNIATFKLDKSKYPVLRVKNFIISNILIENYYSFSLLVDIEGSISDCTQDIIGFLFYIRVETNNVNTNEQLKCLFKNPKSIGKNYFITCIFGYNESRDPFTNIYLLPYYSLLKFYYPIEVIIPNEIKGIYFIPPDDEKKSSANYISFAFILIILFIDLLI